MRSMLATIAVLATANAWANSHQPVAHMATQQQSTRQEKLVKQLFTAFNQATKKPLSSQQIARFYSPQIKVSVNGSQLVSGYQQLNSYLKDLLCAHCKIQFSLRNDELIVAGNNVVLHYAVHKQVDGHWSDQQVMANFTFDHGKIAEWSSVTG